MNLSDLLRSTAEARPEQPALVFEGHARTYAALWAASGAAAARLRRVGVERGDRVALLLPNVPASPVAFFGALRLGAIAVPLNPTLTADELGFMLTECGARALVTVPAVAEALDPAVRSAVRLLVLPEDGALPAEAEAPLAPMAADDPAVIIFSSGTTGRPKGVTLSHGNIVSNVRTNAVEVGMTAADRVLLFMPLFHCYGLNVIQNSAFAVGATVVLERHFEPRATAETIRRARVTMFFGVPTTFIVLLQQGAPEALASLRYCYCAAAPLPRAIEDRWRAEVGLIVHQAYGLSEASPCVAYNHIDPALYRPGSIGVPSVGVEVRIVDPVSLRDVAPGEVGELWVKGPGVMLGYWGRPEDTARVLCDGWLRTGDLGRRDADGYLFITDRLKDMINCGGMKVYPTEVEEALYRHPAVAEVAVVGVPDETMGEVVVAHVALTAGAEATPEALRGWLGARLAGYKRPAIIRVVEALPKGRTGKILRREVRAQALWAREQAVDRTGRRWTRKALQDWIVTWLEAELALDRRVAPDGTFVDAGVDSLLAVRKAEALSTLLGRPVPATVTWLHPTPARLAAYLIDGPELPTQVERPAATVTPLAPPVRVETLSETEAEDALLAELAALGL